MDVSINIMDKGGKDLNIKIENEKFQKMVLLYMDYEEVLQVDNASYNTLEEVREQFNLIKSLW